MSQTTQTSLCVSVARTQASDQRGQAAQWTVSAWTTGGSVTDATVRLRATPANGGAPGFSFGCGKSDGTSACDLGSVDSKSAHRQLQAQLTIPVDASAVKSVRLTVIGNAAHLAKEPTVSSTISITAPLSTTAPASTAQASIAPASPAAVPAPQAPVYLPPVPAAVTSPLPVGSLPSIPAVSPTANSGGSAANLFPTLDPTPTTGLAQATGKARTRPVADTSALPQGDTVVNAQLAGLAALALAFALAVTRLSIRRRPAPAKGTQETGASPAPRQTPNENPPDGHQETPGDAKPDA